MVTPLTVTSERRSIIFWLAFTKYGEGRPRFQFMCFLKSRSTSSMAILLRLAYQFITPSKPTEMWDRI